MTTVLYFAYGSNMREATLRAHCPSAISKGKARLENHRLAFTRRRRSSGTGAADVLEADGFSVWGRLFEVRMDELLVLDKKEGHPEAYTRVRIEVESRPGQHVDAYTYIVKAKEREEISPTTEYLTSLLEGAKEGGIETRYLDFISGLREQVRSGSESFREGLLVTNTRDRSGAQGMPLIRLHPSVATKLGVKRFAAIEIDQRRTLTRVILSRDVAENSCELDQNLRQVLEIPGRFTYGWAAQVRPCRVPRRIGHLIHPRTLVFAAQRPYYLDSERNVCVLHPKNMQMLGVEEGEYVRLTVVVPDGRNLCARSVTLRTSSGLSDQLTIDGAAEVYPSNKKIYLDADARDSLGLPRADYLSYPVTVQPSISRLFASRLILYGVSFILGLSTILQLISIWLPQLDEVVQSLIAIAVAALLSASISAADLRSRVQY